MNAIPILTWSTEKRTPAVEEFLNRPASDPKAEEVAAGLLAAIRKDGAPAILDAVKKFQGATLTLRTLRVTDAELATAVKNVPLATRRAVARTHKQVRAFSKASLRPDWSMRTEHGGVLGEKFSPLDRVGVYVPGGTAPLVSTALMTVTLARVAGVKEIVACTPCGADKKINPDLLYALKVAGATEIYKAGGIQGIGLMAFGAGPIAPVQKIVGPGNAYVTAAKRQVYGFTGIDQIAGPSEIAVIADGSANPAWVAADLLSQAEHGSTLEKSLLITTDAELAQETLSEFVWQAAPLSRRDLIEKTVANGGVMIVRVPTVADAAALANRFAPEHLEVMVRNPAALLPKLNAAGAIFVGPWSPECVGDFTAGPSHVLPTGGAALMFSGLTVEDFRRRSSIIQYTQKDLAADLDALETFGQMEGLDGHGRSASIRFIKPLKKTKWNRGS